MMNSHKQLLFICMAAFLLFPLAAIAQSNDNQSDTQNGQQQAHAQQLRRMAMLAERLNLNDDQKRQWMQIQRQTTQQVRAARNDSSLSEEQMQARLKEIHQQQKDQIMAILTPEQQDELKKFWEEQKQKQQQDKTPDGNSTPGPSAQNNPANQDDLFAGMMPDPDPSPNPPQPKKSARK